MHLAQIGITLLATFCLASARGYVSGIGGVPGAGRYGSGSGGVFGSTPGFTRGLYGGGPGSSDVGPKPYNIGYEAPNVEGGGQFRTEQADGSGAVRGTYGYTDAQGLYRIVEYIADQFGFRAVVNTNEPGVDGKENPADVQMIVGQTPAGIQEQYTFSSAYGPGRAGVGGILGGLAPMYGSPGVPSLTGYSRGGVSGGLPGGFVGIGYAGARGSPGSASGDFAARYTGVGGHLSRGGPLGSVAGGMTTGYPRGLGSSSGGFAGIPRSYSGKSVY